MSSSWVTLSILNFQVADKSATAIKTIKFFAWEKQWMARVESARAVEIQLLMKGWPPLIQLGIRAKS